MNWASLQYAERQNLWQNWTSVPRLQVMMNKFILEEHAVLTCISASDNWSLVIFLFLQTWYGRSKRGSQVFEDCSRSIYICEGKFEGRTSKFLKAALWQMEVTRTVHITSLDFIVQLSTTIYFHLQPAKVNRSYILWYFCCTNEWCEWYDFHTCFKQDDLIGRLSDNTENAIDTDSRVLDAYIGQCTGEAQEGNNLIPKPTTKD